MNVPDFGCAGFKKFEVFSGLEAWQGRFRKNHFREPVVLALGKLRNNPTNPEGPVNVPVWNEG